MATEVLGAPGYADRAKPNATRDAERILAGLRRVYSQGYAEMASAITDALDLYRPADVEVHADRLRLTDDLGEIVTEIGFDIEGVVPRGRIFDVVLDHGRETLFLLDDDAMPASAWHVLDLLRPYYSLVEGSAEHGASSLLLAMAGLVERVDGLLDRPDATLQHRRIRAQLRAAGQGRDAGASEVVRILQQAYVDALRSDADDELRGALADALRVAMSLRRGIRPVLAIRRLSRHAVLRSIGADDLESLRQTFQEADVLSRLTSAHAIDPEHVAVMAEHELMALVDGLRECEFVSTFLMGAITAALPSVAAPERLRDVTALVRSLSSTNAFLFACERQRRAELPQTDQGRRVVGFFPGLGSRSHYQNLGRALLDCGIAEVAGIYADAARALGHAGRPEKLLLDQENLPAGRMAAQGFIGAAFLVHSLAIEAQLRNTAADRGVPVEFVGYTGESFGIITAAVASGALSIADGVQLAQAFTPLMLVAAEGADPADPFAVTMTEYLPDTRLVAEPYHVIGLHGEPRALAEILAAVADAFPTSDVEVHKYYSAHQTNIYVRAGAMAGFTAFAAGHPAVEVEELKAPTTFLAHAERMIVARQGFEKFMVDNAITFRTPHTPVVSNNDNGLLTTATEIRNAVLAITNEIMASRATAETLDNLRPDMVLELGLGEKSVRLLIDNRIDVPTASYTGIARETESFLHAIAVLDDVLGQLANLRDAGDRLLDPHYRTLREVSRLSKQNPFFRRYFYRTMGRVVANEMLHSDRAGSPAFYEMLEIFQHTYNYLNHINVDVGELVLKARLKKQLDGDADGVGQVYAELTVIDDSGTIVDRRHVPGEHAEVVVFHFDLPADLGVAELAHNTRTLLDTQPPARHIYAEVCRTLGVSTDEFLTSGSQLGHLAYQYTLFELLRLHRPAMFMHDYYVEGSDPLGWLVALAVAGASTLADVVRLYDAYLRGDAALLAVALDRMAGALRRADVPVISYGGIPLQSKNDVEAATRVVFS